MKNKKILVSFVCVLSLLNGCGISTNNSAKSTEGCMFPSIIRLFSGNYAYVDILEIEQDYIINKYYYGLTKTHEVLNGYRYIMIKCKIIEDFSSSYEENSIINIPFWCGYEPTNQYLDNTRQYLEQFDKLIIKLIPENDNYYETIEQNSYALVYEENCEYFIGENLMKKTLIHLDYCLGLKDGELDLESYDSFVTLYNESNRQEYHEFKNNLIYDGMKEEDLVCYFRDNHSKI